MVDVSVKDLENLSEEELANLQVKIAAAQSKKRLGSKYIAHKAVEEMRERCALPEPYLAFCDTIKDMEPGEVVPTILNNEDILRFPFLMTLACFAPISEIELRCGLVELFDSYVYHNGPGLSLSSVVPFNVDQILSQCRSHDSSAAAFVLEEQYRRVLSIMQAPMSRCDDKYLNASTTNDDVKNWLRYLADDLVFITHVIVGKNIEYRFYRSLRFLASEDIHAGALNNPDLHRDIVDRLRGNGSDLMFAKRISTCFKLK